MRALQPLSRFCCTVLLGRHVVACYCHHYFRRDRQRHVAPLLGEHGCQSDFRPGGPHASLRTRARLFLRTRSDVNTIGGRAQLAPWRAAPETQMTRNDTLAHAQCKLGPSAGSRFGAWERARCATCSQGLVRKAHAPPGVSGKLRVGRTVRIMPLASAAGSPLP